MMRRPWGRHERRAATERRARNILLSLLVLALAALGVAGGYAGFAATTDNPSDSFAAGSVAIGDNDASAAIYNVSNGLPGDFTEKCVRLPTPAPSRRRSSSIQRVHGGTGLDPYIDLAIAKGSGSQFDCGDFSGSTSVYAGTLGALATTFGGGVALTDQGGAAAWDQNGAATYKVRGDAPEQPQRAGASTGTHSFIWEAQNN